MIDVESRLTGRLQPNMMLHQISHMLLLWQYRGWLFYVPHSLCSLRKEWDRDLSWLKLKGKNCNFTFDGRFFPSKVTDRFEMERIRLPCVIVALVIFKQFFFLLSTTFLLLQNYKIKYKNYVQELKKIKIKIYLPNAKIIIRNLNFKSESL